MALPYGAMAQSPPKADLSPGAFVMLVRHWDVDAAVYREGPPPGSETACFEVGEQTGDGVVLTLRSGRYFQDWAETTVTEYEDTWFSSDRYLAENPGAEVLDELRIMFGNVGSCPSE